MKAEYGRPLSGEAGRFRRLPYRCTTQECDGVGDGPGNASMGSRRVLPACGQTIEKAKAMGDDQWLYFVLWGEQVRSQLIER